MRGESDQVYISVGGGGEGGGGNGYSRAPSLQNALAFLACDLPPIHVDNFLHLRICDCVRENQPVVAKIYFEIRPTMALTDNCVNNAFLTSWDAVGILASIQPN